MAEDTLARCVARLQETQATLMDFASQLAELRAAHEALQRDANVELEKRRQAEADVARLQHACMVFQENSQEAAEVFTVLYKAGLIPAGTTKSTCHLADVVQKLVDRR